MVAAGGYWGFLRRHARGRAWRGHCPTGAGSAGSCWRVARWRRACRAGAGDVAESLLIAEPAGTLEHLRGNARAERAAGQGGAGRVTRGLPGPIADIGHAVAWAAAPVPDAATACTVPPFRPACRMRTAAPEWRQRALAWEGAGGVLGRARSRWPGRVVGVGDRLVTVFLCGDVMTGRGVDQVLPHPGDPELREGYIGDARGYVRLAERASGPIPRPARYAWPWGDGLP